MNIARCKKGLLKQRGIWDKGYEPDSDYIAKVEARDNDYIWRLFYHAQVWQRSVISFVPLIDNLIDVDDVPDTSLYPSLQTVFNTKIRRAASLVVPRILFSPEGRVTGQEDSPIDEDMVGDEGTTAADVIDIPEVVSALAELSTTTPTKKREWVEKKPAGGRGCGAICARPQGDEQGAFALQARSCRCRCAAEPVYGCTP